MKHSSKVRYGAFFNARLTSTISISLVLFVLGIVALLGILAHELSTYVRENMTVSIVLSDAANQQQIDRLERRLKKTRYIKAIEYISKEKALEDLVAQLGENPEEFLGFNPTQASLELSLHADYANNDSLKWIEKSLRSQSNVRDVVYQKDIIKIVNDNVQRITLLLISFAALLMVISFALISNTIRLSAYSKRFIIHTMKLVGATPAFIRRPFILSNMLMGFVAAIVAILLITSGLYYLSSEFDNIFQLISIQTLLLLYAIVIALGIVISAVSAFFAVNKYIRMDRDNLYYM